MRRKRGKYFSVPGGVPPPLRATISHRIRFSEVDAMGIVWHGRYLGFFEQAAEELALRIGLSYQAYREAGLRAPLVQVHVDYHRPLELGERIAVEACLLWSEAARLNTEYTVRDSRGRLAASGFSVQMLTIASSGEPCLVPPPLLEACRARWRRGELGET